MSDAKKSTQGCPFMAGSVRYAAGSGTRNEDWWPDRLQLSLLNQATDPKPERADFNYKQAFASLNLADVCADLTALMTDSKSWWPADFGHYGPFFIRMAWHSAGTYRITDGRGGSRSGALRFAPLSQWPDNVNLDKARRLLWPVKKKYGLKISWADLMVLAGNCALESMGLKTAGFAGGREDVWSGQEDVYWGSESQWLDDKRYSEPRVLENPLAAVQMGLIYVNPEGPNGHPDPVAAAVDIRETFARMGMDDEETVALIAGGHTFGKCHGAGDPEKYVGPESAAAGLAAQGLGWRNQMGTGHGGDTISSGLEVTWTRTPTQWSMDYFHHLFSYEWELTKSPAGAQQWQPKNNAGAHTVPDAHDPSLRHAPSMLTTDLALRMDPVYGPISKHFFEHPEQFADAFAKAWFKLTHRDMGPVSTYLGDQVPKKNYVWQDVVPCATTAPLDESALAALKQTLRTCGLSVQERVETAWASATTFRGTDRRGGANGARIRLDPQVNWPVNKPVRLKKVLAVLKTVQDHHNQTMPHMPVSMADLIVLAGGVGIEQAAQAGGHSLTVPFVPGRTDASQEATDALSFAALEPTMDAFRNYRSHGGGVAAEHAMVDQAHRLQLTAPMLTALLGGLRVLQLQPDSDNTEGLFTDRPGVLSTDFYQTLTDPMIDWRAKDAQEQSFVGYHRVTGDLRWHASRVDLVFGSDDRLRALVEFYAMDDTQAQWFEDFVAAWFHVMQLDRFDLKA